MPISYMLEEKDYVLGNYRSRRLKDGFLIVNDHGGWLFLDKEEFKMLKREEFSNDLFRELERKGFLLTERNVERVEEDYRRKLRRLFNGVSLHIIAISNKCNLNCSYCHANPESESSISKDMDKRTARKIVDFIFQSPSEVIKIEFQGGEPLLNFSVMKEIVEYAKEKNKEANKELSFSLVSNLTLLDNEKLEYLGREGIFVCSSLDGPEKVHDSNRSFYDGKGSYSKISEIIMEHRINSMMIVTKQSLGKEREIVDEYLNMGLDKIWVKPVEKLGLGVRNWEKIGITAEEFLEFWKKILEYIIKEDKEITEISSQIMLRKMLLKKGDNFTDLNSPCGACIGQLAYDRKGDVYSCDEGRQYEMFKIGNVKRKYKEVLGSEEVKAIVKASINDNYLCDNCAFKPYCGVCPVCSYEETGNILSKVPGDFRCRVNMGMYEHLFEKLLFDREYRRIFMKWI